ncbi:MAG: prepilin-type N-terminal cleavage/methylation domain-containing protein [Elusimicrobia bacterium]|nr:prepilin-type N-terminal cleavage/methylation domain-containing protein [Elusimicrobiota bacterium]MBD3411506.1 prepilin-type N-terminal cleavage/methylation domain-containing protein [Elusimicrobiota bacterium]
MKIIKAKGFTLIELMIVVAIIGILAAIAIPKFADMIRKSHEGATKGNLGTMRSALSIYFADIEGFYPCGLDADNNALRTNLTPKYIKSIPSCFCPGYHARSTKEDNVEFDPNGDLDNGHWGYDGGDKDAFDKESGRGAGKDANWGTFWITCGCTDTKSTTWSAY